MKVSIEFPDPYNDRRYSKPWIARITEWPTGQNPSLEFGTFVGTYMGGMCEIEANEGDILRFGQKDYRGSRTVSKWGLVLPDGEVRTISPAQAKKCYDERGIK